MCLFQVVGGEGQVLGLQVVDVELFVCELFQFGVVFGGEWFGV